MKKYFYDCSVFVKNLLGRVGAKRGGDYAQSKLVETRNVINLAHSFLDKICRHIHSNQQYRISLGESMKIPIGTNATIRPAATQSYNMVSGIAIHFQGIGGIRQVEHVLCS